MPETRPQDAAALSQVPLLPEFEALDSFHHEVLAKLKLALRLVDHLCQAGVDAAARTMAGEILDFFSATAREHHAEEERVVFPLLLVRDDGSEDAELALHVKRLQQDHGWLEADWLALAPQLTAIAQGCSWYNLEALRTAFVMFTELNLDHLEFEESLIYPEAKRRMAERTAVGLGRRRAQERHNGTVA